MPRFLKFLCGRFRFPTSLVCGSRVEPLVSNQVYNRAVDVDIKPGSIGDETEEILSFGVRYDLKFVVKCCSQLRNPRLECWIQRHNSKMIRRPPQDC